MQQVSLMVHGSAKFGTPKVSSWLAGNFTINGGFHRENHGKSSNQPCLITRGNPQFTALHTTLDHSIPVASVALAMNHPSNQPEKKRLSFCVPSCWGVDLINPNWGCVCFLLVHHITHIPSNYLRKYRRLLIRIVIPIDSDG